MSKVNILDLQRKKDNHNPITMVTAYDYSSAGLVDSAEIDTILVGDSLGMVMQGHDSTLPVTMDEMIYHCRMVARGAKRAFLIGDMPFLSYQADIRDAVLNAGRFLKEAGMDAVKLEGGVEQVPAIGAIVGAGIPVMGHIGLTPQSVSKLGGYRIQGKSADAARKLLSDALALEQAGCFALVLEAVPEPVGTAVSQRLRIPTIGIGAGGGCDGQVLVYHDLVGLFDRFQPRFVKQYANVGKIIHEAMTSFRQEVEAGQFPTAAHVYDMDQNELDAFLADADEISPAS